MEEEAAVTEAVAVVADIAAVAVVVVEAADGDKHSMRKNK